VPPLGAKQKDGAKQNCAGGVEERRGRSRFFAGAKQNGAGAKQNGGAKRKEFHGGGVMNRKVTESQVLHITAKVRVLSGSHTVRRNVACQERTFYINQSNNAKVCTDQKGTDVTPYHTSQGVKSFGVEKQTRTFYLLQKNVGIPGGRVISETYLALLFERLNKCLPDLGQRLKGFPLSHLAFRS
ncbi:hypothetical protein Bbelb_435850, partial [Branchiostoma belcheri]